MAEPDLMRAFTATLRASADAAGIAISNRRIRRRAYFLQRIHQRVSPAEAARLEAQIASFWVKYGRDQNEREVSSLVGRAVGQSFRRAAA